MFGICGLLYIPDYFSARAEIDWLEWIDAQPWRTNLSRRTQHYGYVYDYKAKRVDTSMYLGAFPIQLQNLAQRFYRDGLMPVIPDQVIINEYEAGQGIADHIDCTPCFGDVILSLSLGSAVIMEFKRDEEVIEVPLIPRSLVTLRDEARYKWTHGIPKRKSDHWQGEALQRRRRVSLTFRIVNLDTR